MFPRCSRRGSGSSSQMTPEAQDALLPESQARCTTVADTLRLSHERACTSGPSFPVHARRRGELLDLSVSPPSPGKCWRVSVALMSLSGLLRR